MEKHNVDSALKVIKKQQTDEKTNKKNQQNFLRDTWNQQNEMLQEKIRVDNEIDSDEPEHMIRGQYQVNTNSKSMSKNALNALNSQTERDLDNMSPNEIIEEVLG